LVILLGGASLSVAAPAPVNIPAACPTMVAGPIPAWGWNWRHAMAPVESLLNSRARMLQFGTIMMCIGLYILMRK
jgi:hypothetical protein